MPARYTTVAVALGAVMASAWLILGLPSAAGDIQQNQCCQQRTRCADPMPNQCTASTSDGGNKTCPPACEERAVLICVPMENKTCQEQFTIACPLWPVKACQAPPGAGEPSSCQCTGPQIGWGRCDQGEWTCRIGPSGC